MSDKQLESTVAAAAHQKEWFTALRRDVFDEKSHTRSRRPICRSSCFSRWTCRWSAISGGRQSYPRRGCRGLPRLHECQGFHEGLCRYCSLSLASTLCSDAAALAPWGGLPRPALLAARLTCDCIQRVFETWAETFGTEFIALDAPGATALPPRWWELSRHRWRELFEPHRLNLMVAQFHG